MAVTLEQLHLATQYPYGPPHESFLFVNGDAHTIVEPGVDPLVDAVVRVDGQMLRASEALCELGAAATPGMAERTPVLSYGSNTSPYGIDRKYRAVYSAGPLVIPAIACDLAGHDVVYSPHFSCWGTVPATITTSPGATAPLTVLYLTPDQLQLMHDIEYGPAPARAGNYVAGRLAEIDLRLDGGCQLSEVSTYVSHYGVLALEQRRVALTALRTRGRRLNHMTGSELLGVLLGAIAPRSSRDEFLARLIAERAFRRVCTARLVETALAVDLPSFIEEAV